MVRNKPLTWKHHCAKKTLCVISGQPDTPPHAATRSCCNHHAPLLESPHVTAGITVHHHTLAENPTEPWRTQIRTGSHEIAPTAARIWLSHSLFAHWLLPLWPSSFARRFGRIRLFRFCLCGSLSSFDSRRAREDCAIQLLSSHRSGSSRFTTINGCI